MFFKRKSEVVNETRLGSFGSYQQKPAAAVQAAYLVAKRIAKVKKTTHSGRRVDIS